MIAPRDAAWAAKVWPRCLEGLDPVATYGPEVFDTDTHPGDRYWAIVDADGAELGMAWANRYENAHMWSYGLAYFPEYRGLALGQGYEVSAAITRELFALPATSALVTLVYTSNPAAMRYNGLVREGDTWVWHGRPHRRVVGHIVDAAGPGIDLWIFQTTRPAWAATQRPVTPWETP
jgi:hypothetical protein